MAWDDNGTWDDSGTWQDGEAPPPPSTKAPRIRPRRSGADLNIEGRTTDTPATGEGYVLTIAVAPSRFPLNESAIVSVVAERNGELYGNIPLYILTDNPAVGDVPEGLHLSETGHGWFTFIGKGAGEANLRARINVDGVDIYSVQAPVEVFTVPPPVQYPMQGWGRLALTLETPFATALVPRVERMSHEEQIRKYGNDRGMEYATAFENETVVFLPKALQG